MCKGTGVKVTAAIFRNGDNVLLMRRAADQPVAGEWEYPGGKFEDGEDGPTCLHRELYEELGIDAEIGDLITIAKHTTDSGKVIELYAYEILGYTGEIQLRVHDDMHWVPVSELIAHPQLPADKKVSEVSIKQKVELQKEYPLPHPLKNDDVETLMKKLRMMVRTMESFNPQATKDKALMGLHSLVGAIISLSAEVYDALQNNRVFVASSITCQILEAEIQLLWLNKHFNTRGKDFIDFGYVEQIEMLRVHPDRKDRVLELLKQNNCDRFLRKNLKNPNILDRNSYNKKWYGDTIQNISEDYFKLVLESIQDTPELVAYYENKDINYENYQLFCGYKHFSPYLVRRFFATSQSFQEDESKYARMAVLQTVLNSILNVCFILEQHGDHILNSKPVATEGLTPASAK